MGGEEEDKEGGRVSLEVKQWGEEDDECGKLGNMGVHVEDCKLCKHI